MDKEYSTHIRSMIDIHITEQLLRSFKAHSYGFSKLDPYAFYIKAYLCRQSIITTYPFIVANMVVSTNEYLSSIYGFTYEENVDLIVDYFENNKWVLLEEIARINISLFD